MFFIFTKKLYKKKQTLLICFRNENFLLASYSISFAEKYPLISVFIFLHKNSFPFYFILERALLFYMERALFSALYPGFANPSLLFKVLSLFFVDKMIFSSSLYHSFLCFSDFYHFFVVENTLFSYRESGTCLVPLYVGCLLIYPLCFKKILCKKYIFFSQGNGSSMVGVCLSILSVYV